MVAEYKANEIFDLAGNYWEWTQEANSNEYRVARGSGSSYTASNRFNYVPGNEVSYTSRATLYIL